MEHTLSHTCLVGMIDMGDIDSVLYWTKFLDVKKEELRKIVERVRIGGRCDQGALALD